MFDLVFGYVTLVLLVCLLIWLVFGLFISVVLFDCIVFDLRGWIVVIGGCCLCCAPGGCLCFAVMLGCLACLFWFDCSAMGWFGCGCFVVLLGSCCL